MLKVMKFGGSSVANAEKLKKVANKIIESYKAGNKTIAVVSAQGKTTDDFIAKAMEINDKPSKREMDVLLSAGEQISMSLLAMAIESEGYQAVSLTGWQAEIFTNYHYSDARIDKIVGERIKRELSQNKIVIIAGFQGINKFEDITTLGRGGSDTTAVAVAVALRADVCEIYTDVDGVYTADPRIVENAYKLSDISYDEMLELASLGANVLHNRCVEMAMKFNMPLEVKCSFNNNVGTFVKEISKVEKMLVRGVTRDNNVARVTLFGINGDSSNVFNVFNLLAKEQISVDIILVQDGNDNKKNLSFSLDSKDLETALAIIEANRELISFEKFESDESLSKVSVVGAGMATNSGVAASTFEAMADSHIPIQMVSTSEIKISMLIDQSNAEKAVNALHEKFM